MRTRTKLSSLALILGISLVAGHAGAAGNSEWRFRVLLEGDPIGHQSFRLTQDGSLERMTIEASMDVKIFFLTVYTYRHSNNEAWEGGCLTSIESDTDDNGTQFRIRGKRESGDFLVDTGSGRTQLPRCVHSFAYWDPEKLRQSSLLNSQTGEYESVKLLELGEELVESRGSEYRARRIALEGTALRIDLWYSSLDNDWLALESRSKSGRMIRYVRE